MSNYSDRPESVRVDFFKEYGKWYTTEAVLWRLYKGIQIHHAFAFALRDHLIQLDFRIRLLEMTAVCLEPCHEHSHPLMLQVSRVLDLIFEHSALERGNLMVRGLVPGPVGIRCPKCREQMVPSLDEADVAEWFCPVCVWRGVWKRPCITRRGPALPPGDVSWDKAKVDSWLARVPQDLNHAAELATRLCSSPRSVIPPVGSPCPQLYTEYWDMSVWERANAFSGLKDIVTKLLGQAGAKAFEYARQITADL